jgi:hypothetical protein
MCRHFRHIENDCGIAGCVVSANREGSGGALPDGDEGAKLVCLTDANPVRIAPTTERIPEKRR